MFAHLRFCFPTFVFLASISTSPAYSNPIADLFNRNATPQQATTPTGPEETCVPRPGQSTRAGLRWVYLVKGKRKCWFQTAGVATKEYDRHRTAKPSGGASAENESTQKRKTTGDASAELMRAALQETSLPMRPTELKVEDNATLPSTEAEASLRTGTDRPTSDYRSKRELEVEALGPTHGNAAAASVPEAPPVMLLIAEAFDDWPDSTWIGGLLMALGLASVLASSGATRRAVLLRR